MRASQNTRHLSHTWGGLDLAHTGGLPRGFHIPCMVNWMAGGLIPGLCLSSFENMLQKVKQQLQLVELQ